MNLSSPLPSCPLIFLVYLYVDIILLGSPVHWLFYFYLVNHLLFSSFMIQSFYNYPDKTIEIFFAFFSSEISNLYQLNYLLWKIDLTDKCDIANLIFFSINFTSYFLQILILIFKLQLLSQSQTIFIFSWWYYPLLHRKEKKNPPEKSQPNSWPSKPQTYLNLHASSPPSLCAARGPCDLTLWAPMPTYLLWSISLLVFPESSISYFI